MIIDNRTVCGIPIRDVYFAERQDGRQLGSIRPTRFIQAHEPFSGMFGIRCFHTSEIDLRTSKEKIFSKFKKNYRNEIRKVECELLAKMLILRDLNQESKARLKSVYQEFSKRRSLRDINWGKLQRLEERVFVSFLDDCELKIFHVYLTDNFRARLLYSVSSSNSQTPKIISAANKFLHWSDMLAFSDIGKHVYDFGGLSLSNPQKKGIDAFKEGFGGDRRDYYNGLSFPNWSGRI